jgi:hypothetical protein
MNDVTAALREAFTEAGYDVGETSRNRDTVRLTVLDPEASADVLRDITHRTLGADDVLGVDITTESADNQDVTTVVSFRYRG